MRSSRKNSMVWVVLLVILALAPGMAGWPAILAEGDDPTASHLDVPEGQEPLSIDGATDEPELSAGLLTGFGLSESKSLAAAPANAASEEELENGVDISGLNGTNWMSKIDGTRLISDINIPGTHDSATRSVECIQGLFDVVGKAYAKCQDLSIREQLDAGIRYLDLRVSYEHDYVDGVISPNKNEDDGKNLWLLHGDWQDELPSWISSDLGVGKLNMRFFVSDSQQKTLDQVLGTIRSFLNAHPTETVIINVARESGAQSLSSAQRDAIIYPRLKAILKGYSDIVYGGENGFSGMPTLGQCRGKIIVLTDHPAETGYGASISGSSHASSVEDGRGRPSMNIAGMKFYFENHYEVDCNEKAQWVRDFYNELGDEMLPITPNEHIGYGMLVQSSSNWVFHASPIQVADTVNPILYTNSDKIFNQRGAFYGWVLSDFVSADTAKTLWITNYPEHIHKMTIHEEVPATCTEPGVKQHYQCDVCHKLYLNPTGKTEVTQADVTLESLGHTPGPVVRENEKEPTRQASGSYEEVVYCTVCKAEISRERKEEPRLHSETVEYVDENGNRFWCRGYAILTNSIGLEDYGEWLLESGWYYMNDSVDSCYDEDDSRRLIIEGNVNLILGDGCTLYADSGIRVGQGSSLTIWTQRKGTGKLVAGILKPNNCAGIGGDDHMAGGEVVIHGGTITAYGGGHGAGIGGGNCAGGGTVTIYGGTVKAYGGNSGAGIGGAGDYARGGRVTVYGGSVDALGGNCAAGIGGGWLGSGGWVVVRGGTVTARSATKGAGIGGGEGGGSGGDVTISGGTVTAIGGEGSAGIGGGYGGIHTPILGGGGDQNSIVHISGGKVVAQGGKDGAGIGGGLYSRGGSVIISGGDVTAIGGFRGGGIGSGARESEIDRSHMRDENIAIFNELIPFEGHLSMTGGRLIAGGGNANAKWDDNANNNTEPAYRAREHGWPAAAALKLGSVSLADGMMVHYGDSKDHIDNITVRTRRALDGKTNRYVIIEACDHANSSYRITDYGHIPQCEYCKLMYGAEQKHTLDSRYECTVCGYTGSSWKIEFDAGVGSGTMDYTRVLKGGKYSLPKCTFTAPSGKAFAGWSVPDQGTLLPGREIEVAKDLVLTATWKAAIELWIGDTQVNYENCGDILGDGTFSYDPDYHVLTVNNPGKIAGAHAGDLIWAGNMLLTVKGTGAIESADGKGKVGIHAEGGLIIDGASTDLTVNAQLHALHSRGITLLQGKVKAIGGQYGALCFGNNGITIKQAATFEASGQNYAVFFPLSDIHADGMCVKEILDSGAVTTTVSGSTIVRADNKRAKALHVLIEPHRESGMTLYPQKPATCTEDGSLVEHYKCDFCGKRLVKNDSTGEFEELSESDAVIPALGHDFGPWQEKTPATATTDGEETRTCQRGCGVTETRVVPATGPEVKLEKVAAVEPTCEAAGNIEYWKMTSPDGETLYGCYRELTEEEATGVAASDIVTYPDEAAGKSYQLLKIDDEDIARPALGHDWGEASYDWAKDYSAVTATSTCGRNPDHKLTETTQNVPGTVLAEATCTQVGSVEYRAVFENAAFSDSRSVTVPATGHTPLEAVIENRTEPTCEEAGSFDEAVYCGVCKEELSRDTTEIPALGHDWSEWFTLSGADAGGLAVEVRFCQRDPSHVEYGEIYVEDYYCSEGDESVWLTRSTGELEFAFSRTFEDDESIGEAISRLLLEDNDGASAIPIDKWYATVDGDPNTLKVFLEDDYLNDLKPGVYWLLAEFNDGEYVYQADAIFTVADAKARTGLVYDGTAQPLVEVGQNSQDAYIGFALGGADHAPETGYEKQVPARTDAGTYYVWYRVLGDGEDEDGAPVCMPVTIAPAALTELTLAEAEQHRGTTEGFEGVYALTYNGSEQTVDIESVKAGTLDVPATSYTVKNDKGTDAGLYVLWIEAEEGGNYTGELGAAFMIEPKDAGGLEVTLSPETFTYSGNENTPSVTVKDGDMVLTKDADYAIEYIDNVNAGSGKVKVTGINGYEGTQERVFTIAKADWAVTPPEARTPTYNGQPQALVNAGSCPGGELQYSLDGETFGAAIPTATDVGTYSVYYKVEADANHNGTRVARIDVTIVDADSDSAGPSVHELVYNGQPQALVKGGSVIGGELQYALGKSATTAPASDDFTRNIPTGIDADTYYVWYRVVGDANHNDVAPACIEVRIAKAPIALGVSITGWTYGEAGNAPSVTGNAGDGSVEYAYSDSADGIYSKAVPEKAGTYFVRASIDETRNYLGGTSQPLSFAIAKASILIHADNLTGFYGDEIQIPTWRIDGNVAPGDDLKITVSTAATSESVPGDYPIVVKWNEDGNYSASVTNGVYTIVRRSASIVAKDQVIMEGEELATGVDQAMAVGLAQGHRLESVKLARTAASNGVTTTTASTINVSGAKIVDANGSNVTKYYDLTYVEGQLTVVREATPKQTVTPTPTKTPMPTATPPETQKPTVTPTTAPEPIQQPVKSDITLLATLKASGKTGLKLSWTKVSKADGYDIFFKKCSGGAYSLIQSVKSGASRSFKVTGLKKATGYKAYVKAWKSVEGVKTYIGKASPVVHAITGGYTKKIANPKAVTVKTSSVTLMIGKSKTIKANVTGVKSGRKVLAHVKLLRYYSSNRNVAEVTSAGKIKATGTGSCTIYVMANNGVRATVKVTVGDGPTRISFKKSGYSVKKGKTLKLAGEIELKPTGASTTYTWISSDPSIATINAKGAVKGVKKGTVTITVSTANGKSAKTKVKVE